MMQALSLGEGAKDVGSRFPEVLRRLERTVDFGRVITARLDARSTVELTGHDG
jgi:hypothetical protein